MSTRSHIAKQVDNDSYEVIYVHSDGYLEGVGQTLLENYDSLDKIDELIDLGNLSSLGDEIEYSRYGTVAYSRDRDEDIKDNRAQTLNFDEIENIGYSSYVYLYDLDGNWQVNHGDQGEFISLEQALDL